MRELGDTVAAVLGRRALRSVPVMLVLTAAAALEWWPGCGGASQNVSRELIRKSLRSTICSPAKIERTLGLPSTSMLRDGVADEIAWLQRESLL